MDAFLDRLNMFPDHTANNVGDVADINVKFSRNVFLAFAVGNTFSNFEDLCRREFGKVIVFALCIRAWAVITPALVFAILHIVIVSTKKQMRGINTWPIVAPMQYPQAIRDRAKMDFPRSAMSQDTQVANACHAITRTLVRWANPGPARVWAARAICSFPKTLLKRLASIVTSDELSLVARPFGDWESFSASTFAKSKQRWIKALSAAMSFEEADMLTPDVFLTGIVIASNGRFLPATTVAAAWLDLLRGILREGKLELHGNLSFLCLIRERCRDAARCFCVYYSFNYSTSEAL